MRPRTRRHRMHSPHGCVASPQGPVGHVIIQAPAGDDRSMSMTAYFAYLHDHEATTDLAKALAAAAMLRTTGAGQVRVPMSQARIAS